MSGEQVRRFPTPSPNPTAREGGAKYMHFVRP